MENERGFANILILVMTAVLLIIAAAAFTSAYRLHKANRIEGKSLQRQADLLRIKAE